MSGQRATIDLDFSGVTTKAAALEALARAFDFPAGFGANWDALADSLQDLSWKPAPMYELRLKNTAAAQRALGADWRTLLEILERTATYWKTRGKEFVVRIER